MKNFRDFNESLGLELEEQDDTNVIVKIYHIDFKISVSKDGNGDDIIKLLPVDKSHKHVIKSMEPFMYLDYWNRRGMNHAILALKKANIPYELKNATSKKTFNIWIKADLNLNSMAALYLQDKFNI